MEQDNFHVYAGKRSAHKGMMNPMDGLSIDLPVQSFEILKLACDGVDRFSLDYNEREEFFVLRADPNGVSFSRRHWKTDNMELATYQATSRQHDWINKVPAFSHSACNYDLSKGRLVVHIPEVRKPPIKRTRRGAGFRSRTEAVVTNPTHGVIKEFVPTNRNTIQDLVVQINNLKRSMGEALVMEVKSDGFLKIMAEFE